MKAEKFAYDELELKPWEFFILTPHQFNQLRVGFYRRRRRQLEDNAHWVTTLVNHYPMRGKGAKSLRIEQLIGYSQEQLDEINRKRQMIRKSATKGKP